MGYPNFRITDDPAGRAVQGVSSGGAAAFKMSFFRPDLFGITISYSGAFVNRGNLTSDHLYPMQNAEFWVSPPDGQGLIMAEPLKKVRYFLGVGANDIGSEKDCIAYPGCIAHNQMYTTSHKYESIWWANKKTIEALNEKGYETRFAYGVGAC